MYLRTGIAVVVNSVLGQLRFFIVVVARVVDAGTLMVLIYLDFMNTFVNDLLHSLADLLEPRPSSHIGGFAIEMSQSRST